MLADSSLDFSGKKDNIRLLEIPPGFGDVPALVYVMGEGDSDDAVDSDVLAVGHRLKCAASFCQMYPTKKW